MATHARPALLGAQDRQRAQQAAEEPTMKGEAGAARDLDGRNQEDALLAFDAFIETWGVKYDRATECLIKDRDALLAFYDFPAELEASAYNQCHRKLVRDGAPPDRAIQGMSLEQDRAGDDLQAR